MSFNKNRIMNFHLKQIYLLTNVQLFKDDNFLEQWHVIFCSKMWENASM